MKNRKRLEQEVISAMRTSIANYHTDPSLARENFQKFHRIFAEYSEKWEDHFAVLWQQMYEIWCAYTPQPVGHYRRTSIEIGYTTHQITRWVNDKVQPPLPTTGELLNRFDQLIHTYTSAQEAA